MESVINSVKFLHRLFNLDVKNVLLFNAFAECQRLTSAKSWFNNLSCLLKRAGTEINEVAGQNVKILVANIKLFLQRKFFDGWKAELNCDARRGDHGNKLRTYRSFKTFFRKEDYLNTCRNKLHRQYLSRLRISAHNLQIERDRYLNNRIPPELRHCKVCNTHECEDEFHFVMKCSKYSSLRNQLFTETTLLFPFFQEFCDQDKFIWLFANLDTRVIDLFAAFVYASFNLRNKIQTGQTVDGQGEF